MLNGPPAAGKTSLAKAIQEVMGEPYFRWGVDTFYATVPSRWAGGPRGELCHQGIFYEGDSGDGTSRRVTGIGYGPVGRQMLFGMHRAFHAFAAAGNNQIIDGLFWDVSMLRDFVDVFLGRDAIMIGVYCSEPVLEQREMERGGPFGLALGQAQKVHDGYSYDLTVDTSNCPSAECAQAVADWLARGPEPRALMQMYGRLVDPRTWEGSAQRHSE